MTKLWTWGIGEALLSLESLAETTPTPAVTALSHGLQEARRFFRRVAQSDQIVREIRLVQPEMALSAF
jgi:hypothetical protein